MKKGDRIMIVQNPNGTRLRPEHRVYGYIEYVYQDAGVTKYRVRYVARWGTSSGWYLENQMEKA